jgi:hypothetical protein
MQSPLEERITGKWTIVDLALQFADDKVTDAKSSRDLRRAKAGRRGTWELVFKAIQSIQQCCFGPNKKEELGRDLQADEFVAKLWAKVRAAIPDEDGDVMLQLEEREINDFGELLQPTVDPWGAEESDNEDEDDEPPPLPTPTPMVTPTETRACRVLGARNLYRINGKKRRKSPSPQASRKRLSAFVGLPPPAPIVAVPKERKKRKREPKRVFRMPPGRAKKQKIAPPPSHPREDHAQADPGE